MDTNHGEGPVESSTLSVTGKIIGLDKKRLLSEEGRLLPQTEFAPTPYSDMSWPVVGELIGDDFFAPIAVTVFETVHIQPDPMFEIFSGEGGIERGVVCLAGEEAKKVVSEAPPEAAILSEEERQALVEEGRALGYEEGRAAALEEGALRGQDSSFQLKEMERSLRESFQTALEEIEKRTAHLSLEIARKIIHTAAELNPEYIIDVIRNTFAHLGAGSALRVRVSPQDFEFIQVVGVPNDISEEERGIEYVADESIQSGCIVETDFGSVNAELDTMWESIKERVLKSVKNG